MVQSVSRLKKTIIVASATALAFAGAGVAVAYWTSTGTGVGTAETGESVAFVIESESPVGILAPGSAGQTVDFSVTNPSPGVLLLSNVTVAIADAAGVAWVPTGDCDAADYTATITTVPGYGSMAAAGSVNGVVTVVLANTGVNQDDCQGQDVPLYLVAS